MAGSKRSIYNDAMKTEITRRSLARWIGWFFLLNTVLSTLLIFSYLRVIPDFHAIHDATTSGVILAWSFLIISFIAQMSLFNFAMAALVFIVCLILPWRWLVFTLAILLASFLQFVLTIDSVIFVLYKFHLAMLAWQIFQAGAVSQVILLSTPEKLFILSCLIGFIAVQSLLAWLMWWMLKHTHVLGHGANFAVALVVVFTVSYLLMFISTHYRRLHIFSPTDHRFLIKAARVVPYYNEIYEQLMPGEQAVRSLATSQGWVPILTKGPDKKLRYPLQPLQCSPSKPLLNIVIIAIDTWRYQSFNNMVTPNIFKFAQHAWQFTNHWSGGNSTKPGIFTLFYSLPPTYWDAFREQEMAPILIRQLLSQNYQFALLLSAPMTFPPMDKTVFKDIPNKLLFTPGVNSKIRDRFITHGFIHFIKNRDTQRPFFSFLFYDAAHNYCDTATPFQKPFQPAIKECDRISLTNDSDPLPYINRYKNAVHFNDQEIGKVLTALKQQGLMKNTVVIITSDHGEQLNDEGMGYWQHASAYTPHQLKVPLIIHWPGESPKVVNYLTTQYDIVPFLLQKILGCVNPIADYSVGAPLLTPGGRDYFIAGSYKDYAVITPQQILRVYPGGDYQINFRNGRPNPHGKVNAAVMHAVFQVLNRYYQKQP